MDSAGRLVFNATRIKPDPPTGQVPLTVKRPALLYILVCGSLLTTKGNFLIQKIRRENKRERGNINRYLKNPVGSVNQNSTEASIDVSESPDAESHRAIRSMGFLSHAPTNTETNYKSSPFGRHSPQTRTRGIVFHTRVSIRRLTLRNPLACPIYRVLAPATSIDRVWY